MLTFETAQVAGIAPIMAKLQVRDPVPISTISLTWFSPGSTVQKGSSQGRDSGCPTSKSVGRDHGHGDGRLDGRWISPEA